MIRPLPVLILDNTFSFGGAINSLRYLLATLDKNSFAPMLVTGQPREFLLENFQCAWFHFIPKLPWVNNKIHKRIRALGLFQYRLLRKALNLTRFCYWIIFITFPETFLYYRLGRKHEATLVHLNNLIGTQLAGILAAKLLRVPCIAHMRDFEEIHPITRVYARWVDYFVAISQAVGENLKQLGVPKERISVVHDAIDVEKFDLTTTDEKLIEEFGIEPTRPTFGIFGRVVEWKGIRQFIHATRLVMEEIPSAAAFVVGGPSAGEESFFDEMQQLSETLGLAGQLVFTGYRRDIAEIMGLMDVIVHASTRPEPFGMVIIEGMAMRKPIVATRGGGPLDIVVENRTGLLVEMGNAEALGKAILTLLRKPELQKEMGAAGREIVEKRFSSRYYAECIGAIYKRMAQVS
jgi:glycosyltransferase involved in cell wall biosynthesis